MYVILYSLLDSHFGTVTKIASEELEFTICDTSCEAENGKKDYFDIRIDLNELIQYNLPVEIEYRQYCICMHIKKIGNDRNHSHLITRTHDKDKLRNTAFCDEI